MIVVVIIVVATVVVIPIPIAVAIGVERRRRRFGRRIDNCSLDLPERSVDRSDRRNGRDTLDNCVGELRRGFGRGRRKLHRGFKNLRRIREIGNGIAYSLLDCSRNLVVFFLERESRGMDDISYLVGQSLGGI
jgi:hypothetical protein